ncbi:hypothetical protein AC249_AIPGENE24344, partial [Exaiptasia diaphana]
TQPDVNSFDSVSSEKSRLARTIENLRRGLGHVVDTEDVYRPYLTTNETRYTEVVFVVDNGVYERFKDTKPVINKVLTLCNAVDAVSAHDGYLYHDVTILIISSSSLASAVVHHHYQVS